MNNECTNNPLVLINGVKCANILGHSERFLMAYFRSYWSHMGHIDDHIPAPIAVVGFEPVTLGF